LADEKSWGERLNGYLRDFAPVAAIAGVTAVAYALSVDGVMTVAVLLLTTAVAGGLLSWPWRPLADRRPRVRPKEPFSRSIPVAMIAGLIVILGYSTQRRNVDLIGVLFMAGGAAVIGVFIGFLFGIPRIVRRGSALPNSKAESKDGRGDGRRLNPNTNLEEISDWLTKIIVGITLFEAGDLLQRFNDLTAYGATLGVAKAGAGAIVLYFSVAGFLSGYLWTRIDLTRQFAAGDRAADEAAQSRLRAGLRIEPKTDLYTVFATLKDLLDSDEVQAAVNIGRDFLLWKESSPANAEKILSYLKQHVPRTHERYHAVLSNLGYSYIDQGRYQDAVIELLATIEATTREKARPWHTVALAFAYWKLNDEAQYQKWLIFSRSLPEFPDEREALAHRYQEINKDLLPQLL
jgi:hypothetical protein